MTQFVIDSEKIDYIAKNFNLTYETVDRLFKNYQKLQYKNKNQYLAHIMRSLEEYIRENCNAPFFRISCKPSSNNPALKGTGCASYKKGISFVILYDSSLSPKDARVVIAHELGHLFWITLADKKYDDTHEPLSSVFGIFTIMDKNDFYADKANLYQHDSWQSIISDFSLLKNKAEEKYNIS